MATVVVENYNPNWAKEFRLLKSIYEDILKEYKVTIEHVGSTSVEGLAAKPILDIDIVMEDETELPSIINELEKVGYKSLGEMGIIGRYAFERISQNAPTYNDNNYEFRHNLYVCKSDAVSLRNHLLFRDYLRKDKAVLQEYANLKKDLAKKYSDDIDSYCEAKTDFITSILEKAGLKQTEIEDISSQNRI